jgi:MOSC domain-containing protein YiiM
MRLVSVNVALPREIVWRDRTITTGIFKEPVEGRVRLRTLNLEGDRQADLTVHGGADKAVYAYPLEHYDYWRRELPGMELPFGMFGENFTIEGLQEAETHIGDRFRIGTAELVATQPRLPCYKLGAKFQDDDMVKRFLRSGRTGFYFSVAREGEVGAGDEIERVARGEDGLTIPEITRLYLTKRFTQTDLEILHRAVRVQALPENWRSYFLARLENAAP